jgi:hypothetical protein
VEKVDGEKNWKVLGLLLTKKMITESGWKISSYFSCGYFSPALPEGMVVDRNVFPPTLAQCVRAARRKANSERMMVGEALQAYVSLWKTS